MAGISPADGPVAVTGASGYIGSWIVQDLLEQGYEVRACVRDASNAAKTDHLSKLKAHNRKGSLTLVEADLTQAGSYDQPFTGAAGVIHAGAAVGYNKETPQQVYDGCFTQNKHLVESVKNSDSVKRLVFTSSFAAVGHPRPAGYLFTEKDWCGDNVEAYNGQWSVETIPKNRDIAYAMAKANTERMIYAAGADHSGFEALAILPLHVIGPLMCANHDQNWSWQNCIKFMMNGKGYRKSKGGRMLWNLVDVRDVARAHRLAIETNKGNNGSRYILSAEDSSGEMFTWQLRDKLASLFPKHNHIEGEEMIDGKPAKATYDSPRAHCLLAKEQLGLQPLSVEQSLKDTVESYIRLGMVAE